MGSCRTFVLRPISMAGVPHSKSGDWIFRAELHHSDVFAKDAFRVIVEVQVLFEYCLSTKLQSGPVDRITYVYMLIFVC